MTKRNWSLFGNIALACTALLSIISGVIEQRQMEQQIRDTVEEVLSERSNDEES